MLRFGQNNRQRKEGDCSLKRKSEEDACAMLEDNIKRFRITNTPGEIRLNKDIKEVKELTGVHCELTDSPECVAILFDISCIENTIVPRRFSVKISKYYPHCRPVVTCLENNFRSTYITSNGEVLHPILQENWSALCSLKTVIVVLDNMRTQLLFNQPPSHDIPVSPPLNSPVCHRFYSAGNMSESPMMIASPGSATDTEYLAMEN